MGKKPPILLIVKARNADAAALAVEIMEWFDTEGYDAYCVRADEDYTSLPEREYALVVVLGGDGTLLNAARRFVPRPRPLLGINFGKVGFLTESRSSQWREALASALTGQTRLLRRTALAFEVSRDANSLVSGFAVNDVVINRGCLARVINFDVKVQNVELCRLRADGLIISSPQGCSGYAASAGGPLVHPDICAFTLVPICPFLCSFPPLVLPHPYEACIRLTYNSTDTYLTVDGQEGHALRTGDTITVRALPGGVLFAGIAEDGYLHRLKEHGFLAEHSGHPQR